ncbi:MAG: TraR/DksA C4-type zinc finger protein [Phycisphaeraceae bacterium]|nr:TraR/DksA C4-type zinc finger protein [Phycisphaeraceae bacterium]
MLRRFAGRRDRSIESSQPDPADVQEASLSLRRAQQGLFGVCADCGAVIEHDQLRIRPQAVLCVRCQEIHETQVHSDPLSSWIGGLAHA